MHILNSISKINSVQPGKKLGVILFLYLILSFACSPGNKNNINVDKCNATTAFMPEEPLRDMVLWYNQPGKEWLDGMPIGNGYMGAMVFGRTGQERIALNESSFWSGRPHDYNDPDAINYFPKIKDLVFTGKFQEAEKMADEHFWGIPAAQEAYEPLGDLMLSFEDSLGVQDYRRELDMETGITSVQYRIGDVSYTREVFLSYPDRVMVVRIKADKPGHISVQAALQSPFQDTILFAGNRLIMDGKWKQDAMKENWLIASTSGEGIRFQTLLEAFPEGGEMQFEKNHVNINNADAVTFLLTAATSYVNYKDISGQPDSICSAILSKAQKKDFQELRDRHVADFNGLMGRVHLEVGDPSLNEKPTDERLQAMRDGESDAGLEVLCFQFGRYILVSSSRSGGQPANLQAIWNEVVDPNWGSKYTININTEMNYWPSEVCNLSECGQPLFSMIKDISENGQKTAKLYYGCDGWVTHHNIDLWRGTAPVDAARFGMWPIGGAWLCQHLWEHYTFTRDTDFLKEYYPVMKGSAEFLLDLMVEHPEYHWLVTPSSMSPEHGYYDSKGNMAFLSPSPTMDVAIIRELFPHCIETSEILGVDSEFRAKLEEALPKIPPYQIGKSGFLQEWIEDWEPGSQGHNFSRNFPFFPGNSIQLRRDKELSLAMQKWMETRNSRGGFPLCWDICMWSRLEQGDEVAKCIQRYVSNSPATNLHNRGSNQSDATFGFTAGVAESLLQSHAGEINLLPALNTNWQNGSVSGLCARGKYEIAMTWENGKLEQAKIKSYEGGLCRIRNGHLIKIIDVKPGGLIVIDADLNEI